MIMKTFFLMKVIHRIRTQSLRGKKGLLENFADYGHSSHCGQPVRTAALAAGDQRAGVR
jgi:hypothetical protein